MELYFSAAAGVVASVLLPIMVHVVRDQFNVAETSGKASLWKRAANTAWPYVKKYLILLCFSLVVACVIVAVLGDTIHGWKAAFLAGYAWDSTIQKLIQKG